MNVALLIEDTGVAIIMHAADHMIQEDFFPVWGSLQLKDLFFSLSTVPLPISGVVYQADTYSRDNVTVRITWDEQVGVADLQYMADIYEITIAPLPLNNMGLTFPSHLGRNITPAFAYNVEYRLRFFARNCIGISEPSALLIIRYSELVMR